MKFLKIVIVALAIFFLSSHAKAAVPAIVINNMEGAATASTNTLWCLNRTILAADGKEQKVKSLFYKPGDVKAWVTIKDGVINKEHNAATMCQHDDQKCNIEVGDIFKISVRDSAKGTFNYKRRRADFDSKEEESVLTMSKNELYLGGRVKVGGKEYGDIFVFFSDNVPCLTKGRPAMMYFNESGTDLQRCNTYTIEIFPDEIKKDWEKYKPNHPDVTWETANCIPPLQPGGGGGHDPP